MSTEQNKAIVYRLIEEVINTGRSDQMGKFIDAKAVDHNPSAKTAWEIKLRNSIS